MSNEMYDRASPKAFVVDLNAETVLRMSIIIAMLFLVLSISTNTTIPSVNRRSTNTHFCIFSEAFSGGAVKNFKNKTNLCYLEWLFDIVSPSKSFKCRQ